MIYKEHHKIDMIIGSKIKILILYLKCFKMLCLRRILSIYIHDHTLYTIYLYEDMFLQIQELP